jgi:hypothetical protein
MVESQAEKEEQAAKELAPAVKEYVPVPDAATIVADNWTTEVIDPNAPATKIWADDVPAPEAEQPAAAPGAAPAATPPAAAAPATPAPAASAAPFATSDWGKVRIIAGLF